MIRSVFKKLQIRSASRKASQLAAFLGPGDSVLDFGCGDLSLAYALKQRIARLSITGIDVVDFGVRYPDIRLRAYTGRKLPFADGTFDTVVSYHVFHHTTDPVFFFRECARVARQKILFAEPVYRFPLEIPGMRFMDWVFNVWKKEPIPMTYTFRSRREWLDELSTAGFTVTAILDVEVFPRFFPTGRSLLFVSKRQRRFSKGV